MDVHPTLAVARALAPEVAARADQIDREKRLPSELVDQLAAAGLFRLLVPRALGGAEMELPTYVLVIEELARADASTAWCVNQSCVRATTAAWLDPASGQAVFGDDRTAAIANGPLPGRAVAVAGGYRLSGRWTFASGIHHAGWLAALARVVDAAGEVRRWADGSPEVRHMLVPAADARVEPAWEVAGLRGTGSDDFTLEDVFVPAERAVAVGRTRRHHDGPIYLIPVNLLFACGFAMVAIGNARSALDAAIELAGAKTPRGTPGVLREQAMAQMQVGRAEAHLRAGRALLRESIDAVYGAVAAANAITLEQRALLRLATTHAIHEATLAVDLAYTLAGATAIYAASPLQRRFQDAHVITQHVQGRLAHYESAGRFYLGLEPDLLWL